MFKKIVKFAKYNTLTMVIIAVAFIAVASAMANEDIKNKVIGEEIVEKSGVDNSVLLAADLENYDLAMQITGAMEDPPEVEDGNFYIDYQYKTLAIKDSVWQEVLYSKQMTVSKRSLDGRDLGLYVMEELGEIIDYQLAYLKEVQENEADKGVTVVLETTEYTGLIGLILDTKTKELPGYEPVVKPEVAEIQDDARTAEGQSPTAAEEIVEESAIDVRAGRDPPLQSPDDEIPAEAAYWEQVENNCLNNGGFWYGNICNAEEEGIVNSELGIEEEEPVVEELPEEDPVSEEPEEEPVEPEPVVEPETEEESVEEPEAETETAEPEVGLEEGETS